MKERGKQAAGSIEGGAERIGNDLADRSDDLSAKAKSLAGDIADTTGDLYEQATGRAKDAMSSLPSSADARRIVRQGPQQVKHRVRHQPVEALLLAGAIGYLVGWATSR